MMSNARDILTSIQPQDMCTAFSLQAIVGHHCMVLLGLATLSAVAYALWDAKSMILGLYQLD